MTRLTLIDNYYYTENIKDLTYYVYYKLIDVLYTTTLDCQASNADVIVEYVLDNYKAMMYDSSMTSRPILIIEETIEEDTLADVVALLKQAAYKAMLSDDQEIEVIEKVCGWAGQGFCHQDPTLPQGYEGRTVIAYPYTPGYVLGIQHHRLCDTRHALHGVEVCGIPTVLVEKNRPHTNTHSYTSKVGMTAEEAARAVHRLQAAYNYGASTQQVIDLLQQISTNTHPYNDGVWGNGTVEAMKDQGLQQHRDIQSHAEGTATYAVCSTPTAEDKPVCVAYEGKDIHTQQHSDTHTHIQQEDSTVDTYTLLHNDVVYDTLDIDTYIHTALDTTTLY